MELLYQSGQKRSIDQYKPLNGQFSYDFNKGLLFNGYMKKRDRQSITSKNLKMLLKPQWEAFNKSHFEGTLTRCPNFVLCPNPKFLAAYSFTLKKHKISNGQIIFSERFFYQASSKMFKEALLHEMAHQFVIEILKLPHQNHGPIWKMICKALGIKPQAKTPWHG